MPPSREPWNHNVHYHRVLLRAVPRGAETALDVGCGDGRFARELAGRVRTVQAVDSSPEMVAAAQQRHADVSNLHIRCDDFMTAPLAPGSFDYISSLAAIHHMPFREALERMAELLRPCGVLAVLGLYDEQTPADLGWARAAIYANRVYLRRNGGEQPYEAPTQSATMTLRAIRSEAREVFPSVRVRRRLLWRYTLIWRKAG